RVMAKIRGKDTGPEKLLAERISACGITCERHCIELPGRPDFVFRNSKVVVFVDGDFWHGYRFSLWSHKLSERWRLKIATTRARDHRNFRKLRRLGWKVIRIWEHQVEQSCERCLARVLPHITIPAA